MLHVQRGAETNMRYTTIQGLHATGSFQRRLRSRSRILYDLICDDCHDLLHWQFLLRAVQPYLLLLERMYGSEHGAGTGTLVRTYLDALPYHCLISRDDLPAGRLEELSQIRPWPRYVTHLQHDTGFWFIPEGGFSHCKKIPSPVLT